MGAPTDPPAGAASEPLDDDDLGAPLTDALRLIEDTLPVSDSFLGRLERRIERRQIAAELSRMWWEVPGAVLREVMQGLLSRGRPAARRRPPREAPPDPEESEADPDG